MSDAYVNNDMIAEDLGLVGERDKLGDIQKTVAGLTDDYLDPSLTFAQQDPSWISSIQAGICEWFPEVFEDISLDDETREKRMSGAMEFVRRKHHKNRQKYDSSLSGRGSTSTGPVHEKRGFRPAGGMPHNPLPAATSSSAQALPQSPPPTPRPVLPPPIAQALDPLGRRSHEVEEFLSACKPNMAELLDAFMASGCYNRNFLAAMATWGEIDIHRTLESIILKGSRLLGRDRAPTWMELHVLQYYLKVHFPKYQT